MLKGIDPDEALKLVLEHSSTLGTVFRPPAEALGFVLAEDVEADRDYPPFNRAMMDGFAVVTADAGKKARISGEVAAGQTSTCNVSKGSCVRIMTGAPCPEGTEAVIEKEKVEEADGEVRLPAEFSSGRNIAPQGSEAPKGTVILKSGDLLTPIGVGVTAAVGRYDAVEVYRFPRVSVVVTGSELTSKSNTPGPAQIRDSNGPMLRALLANALPRVENLFWRSKDTCEELVECLEEATEHAGDVVVLTGGVSAGKYDCVPEAIEQIGAEIVFHKVKQKPGKPLLFARKGKQLFFGLPGNPLAVHMCFHRYVVPAIRKMAGGNPLALNGRGRLAAEIQSNHNRYLFCPARVEEKGGETEVTPLRGEGSADIFATHAANAFVRLSPGPNDLKAGAEVSFEWIGA